MTQEEGLRLARKIVDAVMSDLGDRMGIIDDVEEDVRQEMRAELFEAILDDLPFIDDGTRL